MQQVIKVILINDRIYLRGVNCSNVTTLIFFKDCFLNVVKI